MKACLFIYGVFVTIFLFGCAAKQQGSDSVAISSKKKSAARVVDFTKEKLAVPVTTIRGEDLPLAGDAWNKKGSVFICPKDLKLFGDWLFAPTYNSGRICRFKRDLKTAEIKYVNSWVMPFTHHVKTSLFFRKLSSGTYMMYAIYNKQHLYWYTASRKTGDLVEKGNMSLPANCRSTEWVMSPDEKSLYVVAKGISRFAFDDVGTPSLKELVPVVGKGVNCVISEDGAELYLGSQHGGDGVNGILSIYSRDLKTGMLQRKSFVKLGAYNDLKRSSYPFVGVSPDGRHLYVSRWSWDSGNLSIFTREKKSGLWKLTSSVKPHAKMKGVCRFAFSADGAYGYSVAGAEGAGRCTGWFMRNVKTGELTYKGSYRATAGRYKHLIFDRENDQLFSASWSHSLAGSTISSFKTPEGK